jgi:hypothetical protein
MPACPRFTELQIVNSTLAEYGEQDIDDYLWTSFCDPGVIQVDGDTNLNQLKCLPAPVSPNY